MPKIIINEIEKNLDLSSVNNLQELHKSLLEKFKAPESFVTKIRLNNNELNEKELQNNDNLPIRDIEIFELTILTIPEMALNNVNNAMEYLNLLIPGVEKTSELFRTKSSEEANKSYLECIEGLTWFQEVIENVKIALKQGPSETSLDSKNAEEFQKRLVSLTKELTDAQSKKDWVMLADLLEYELAPFLEEWRSLLPSFVKAIQNKISSESCSS